MAPRSVAWTWIAAVILARRSLNGLSVSSLALPAIRKHRRRPRRQGVLPLFLRRPDCAPCCGTDRRRKRKRKAGFGRQFKLGSGDHPPAIELHLGNRYFAVTDQQLPDAQRYVSCRAMISYGCCAKLARPWLRSRRRQGCARMPVEAQQLIAKLPRYVGRQNVLRHGGRAAALIRRLPTGCVKGDSAGGRISCGGFGRRHT